MNAEELMQRYSMSTHLENGAFCEKHYPACGAERAASGSIYYYVAPGERTAFHQIDCDEYWIYNLGAPLELWAAEPEGKLVVRRLGAEDGCEPMIYLPKGTVFASRLPEDAPDGTFLTCITVPRFSYEGFTLIGQEQMTERYPEAKHFYQD